MGRLNSIAASARQSVSDSIFEVKVLHEAGIVGPLRPDKAAKVGDDLPALGRLAGDRRRHRGDRAPARDRDLIDERGSLSFERLHRRSNALAHAFAAMGIGPGDGIGIMCRNHRGFVEATLAAAKLGASALYLNTMFAGPQLVEVTQARGTKGAGLRRGVRRPARRGRRRRRPHRRLGRRRGGRGRRSTR